MSDESIDKIQTTSDADDLSEVADQATIDAFIQMFGATGATPPRSCGGTERAALRLRVGCSCGKA